MSEPSQLREGQRQRRQLATPRLKTQLEIGKEYTASRNKNPRVNNLPFIEEFLLGKGGY